RFNRWPKLGDQIQDRVPGRAAGRNGVCPTRAVDTRARPKSTSAPLRRPAGASTNMCARQRSEKSGNYDSAPGIKKGLWGPRPAKVGAPTDIRGTGERTMPVVSHQTLIRCSCSKKIRAPGGLLFGHLSAECF